MNTTIVSRSNIPISSIIAFTVGAFCMFVTGYFLIEGLSEFSGSRTARNMLIFGGVLVQVGESVSFMYASISSNRVGWRIIMFSLGVLLFVFSVIVVTLAQKTAIQTGETAANAIDERAKLLRSQIDSLDQAIASYRANAEQQSQSIYAQSRALGQDSINRAVELESQKISLRNELFQTTQQRRQTSTDYFNQLEEVTGLPATETEFYFFVSRSLIFELAGIIFLSFAAFKKKEYESNQPTEPVALSLDCRLNEKGDLPVLLNTRPHNISEDEFSDPTGLPMPSASDVFFEPVRMDDETQKMVDQLETALNKPNKHWADKNVRQLREFKNVNQGIDSRQEFEQLVSATYRLYIDGETTLGRDKIRQTLKHHHDINIGSDKAMEIAEAIKEKYL